MRMVDLILAKRNGRELTGDEIRFFIHGYVDGTIPDYQAAAFLMAVYFKGMTSAELGALALAMIDSGERFDLSGVPGIPVDKHSTGGVGDKVSLILAPLVAAAGVPVPMISGRGLGHTGGTLDKLDAIPGFQTAMTQQQFVANLKQIGLAMSGQSETFVPADKKIYALRDVTGTIESIPLIASSIMSKKVAEGARGLALDVKTGNGAFMSKLDDARNLARILCGIGRHTGVNVVALITDMNQPLGREVGHANEVIESIEVLKGNGPADTADVTFALAAEMLVLGAAAKDTAQARRTLQQLIDSGRALDKFRQMCEVQGGDPNVVEDYSLFHVAEQTCAVQSPDGGFIASFNTSEVGTAAAVLGAGRARKSDTIDHGVGITVLKKIGDPVAKGEPVYRIAWRDANKRDACIKRLKHSYTIKPEHTPPPRLIKERIVDV